VYEKDGSIYYGFTESKYISPTSVSNYIVNPSAFTSTSGWYVKEDEAGAKPILSLTIDPPISDITAELFPEFTSYLKFANIGTSITNSSISGYRSVLNEFVKDKTEMVLRLKYKIKEEEALVYGTTAPVASIKQRPPI
jgi:hypothetical protein